MCRLLYGFIGLPLLLAAGCTPSVEMPKTYPARGSVVYKDGAPMKGGSIYFKSSTDPSLRVFGHLQDDGTFTLDTLKGTTRVSGAPEGEYEVTVEPPMQGHSIVPAIPLPKPRKVETRDNQFRIELTVPPSPPEMIGEPGKK